MQTGEHEASTGTYVGVWAALVALTAVTVAVSLVDLRHLTLFVALTIATVKAALVASYFMHLRWQARIYTVVLLVGLGTLGIFLGLTFADVEYRYF
jgi:cytochrome c oxidase subunit 4